MVLLKYQLSNNLRMPLSLYFSHTSKVSAPMLNPLGQSPNLYIEINLRIDFFVLIELSVVHAWKFINI